MNYIMLKIVAPPCFSPPGRPPTSQKLCELLPCEAPCSLMQVSAHTFSPSVCLTFSYPWKLTLPCPHLGGPPDPLSQGSLPVLLYPMGGTHCDGPARFLVACFLQGEYHSNHYHQRLQRACHIVGPQRKIRVNKWIKWASVLKSLPLYYFYYQQLWSGG